jgi:hypothetical protein
MSRKVFRGKHGMILMPRQTAMQLILHAPKYLPKKYQKAGVTMVMPEPAALAWLDALKNSEALGYQRCQGALFDGKNGFCCLGIEQDVNYGAVEVDNYESEKSDDPNVFCSYPTLQYLLYTNKMFYNASGIVNTNPAVKYENTWTTAGALNDEHKLSFPEIGKLLRPHIAVYQPLPQDIVRHDTP